LNEHPESPKRHEREPEDVHGGATGEHPKCAVPVGDRPGEWLRRAPQQVLQGERQREYIAAPAVVRRHRRQEKAERGARPE
jgi:hypothetical protein